jgi:hypothetical protein
MARSTTLKEGRRRMATIGVIDAVYAAAGFERPWK